MHETVVMQMKRMMGKEKTASKWSDQHGVSERRTVSMESTQLSEQRTFREKRNILKTENKTDERETERFIFLSWYRAQERKRTLSSIWQNLPVVQKGQSF